MLDGAHDQESSIRSIDPSCSSDRRVEDVRDHHLEFIIGESASVDWSFQFGYDDLDELWANLGEETPKKTGPARWTGGSAMPRLTTLFTLSAMAPLMASPLRAEHAKINLEVATLHNNVSAFADQTPPQWGKNPRPILTAKVNEPLRIQFLITNVYPHKTLENVVVHFYIARQKRVGQKELPDLKGEMIIETAFDMDFKPGGKAGQKSSVKIDAPECT